ncbi:hypothetical protein LTR09_011140 [Extremus antarcticus]|uniref:Glycosyl transferase CAP10 domain-containing protein n=1 Tax=Extremus antarcticus TaxID=702011 RepID=A0AAJ0G549_9PEZI|nr:hypothetical protein LTR09_011140 [Extremus antarcticus]
MPLVSAPSLNSRFTQLAIAAGCLVAIFWFFAPTYNTYERLRYGFVPGFSSAPATSAPGSSAPETQLEHIIPTKPKPHHPIDDLIAKADEELNALLAKETTTLHDAAHAYRERRGRQPPPGFGAWFAFAQKNSAIVVEEFWDRIYDDLNPFWGVPAKQIREQASNIVFRISVRGGKVTYHSDGEERPWMELWTDLIKSIVEEVEWEVPDVDVPINHMDESRMVVAWEEIDAHMREGEKNKRVVEEGLLVEEFPTLEEMDRDEGREKFDPEWVGGKPYWQEAVTGCHPESPARKAEVEVDFSLPPPLLTGWPQGSYEGYVQNWTLAKSPCDNPHLQGLHGTFVEPISMSNTKKFFPMFGGSKLPMNNEILLPAAMYWTEDPFYSGGDDHGEAWRLKKSEMIWRGAASGGRNTKKNWTRFQRHRFVSMVNATSVYTAETDPENAAPNFALPANNSYNLAAQSPSAESGAMSEWVESWSDPSLPAVGVVHLLCHPLEPPEEPRTGDKKHTKACSYTNPYFRVEKMIPMKEQYDYKYLPDIDGNSFSGRYRGFLGSTSLPIKATIYEEWHDSRLVAWKHFVPMDNSFVDLYGVMEYFVGVKKTLSLVEDLEGEGEMLVEGHDEQARDIAIGGKRWADKVLRREDMQVYVLRLLLEYARVASDGREVMGWRENHSNSSGAALHREVF